MRILIIRIKLLITITVFSCSLISFDQKFAYISCQTLNIGDDIQSIAAMRFLPPNSISIERERVSEFSNEKKILTLMNGWFMYTKETWDRSAKPLPQSSWPPSKDIEPLLISLHFNKIFFPYLFTKEGIEYLKKYGPVGTRDLFTLNELQKRNIPSYFSGCLTLTLINPYIIEKRENIIYAVDIDHSCLEYLKKHTKSSVEYINHMKLVNVHMSSKERLQIAQDLLKKYATAKCVITSRLHACLPCLALQTPVLVIRNNFDERFQGLKNLFRHCSVKDFLQGNTKFDFDNPEKNSNDYLQIRNNLITTINNWLMNKSNINGEKK